MNEKNINIVNNIMNGSKKCDINKEQNEKEKNMLLIGIETIYQQYPYNTTLTQLQLELEDELKREIAFLIDFPEVLAVANNCNKRLRYLLKKIEGTRFEDFRFMSEKNVKFTSA